MGTIVPTPLTPYDIVHSALAATNVDVLDSNSVTWIVLDALYNAGYEIKLKTDS